MNGVHWERFPSCVTYDLGVIPVGKNLSGKHLEQYLTPSININTVFTISQSILFSQLSILPKFSGFMYRIFSLCPFSWPELTAHLSQSRGWLG